MDLTERTAFCYRCGHLWAPRTDAPPRRCPRCHSSRWDVPEKRVRTCKFCGTGFQMGALDDPCPSCGRRQTEPLSDRVLHCNQCDYEWTRRKDTLPRRCPLCHSEEWNLPKADRLMCQQCGHVWRRQTEHPAKCPKCQSEIWDQPLRVVRCQRCGHVWKMRRPRSDSARSVCPGCRTLRWDEPMLVSRTLDDGVVRYSRVNSQTSRELIACRYCGHRWYLREGDGAACPRCGTEASYRDRLSSTSMVLWTDGRLELTYVTENGYGCVYLWNDDMPIACRYIHEVLGRLGMTIGEVVDGVNRGELREEFGKLAEEMARSMNDYEIYIDYFMKRLMIRRSDARILAIHFTGMSPEAIARRFSYSEEYVHEAFDRIMAAYSDSGIVVDDTIYTEDPFRYYRRILNEPLGMYVEDPASRNKSPCFYIRIY